MLRLKNPETNYKLIILGKNTIKNYNHKDIYFAGDIDYKNLPKWYRTGNVFLHLAWIEPAGNSHLEAIACGLPVLCTNNGGINETVISTNSGVVSKADDEYLLDLVDFYNPPRPNFEILFRDFMDLKKNLTSYPKNIKLDSIDIDIIAKYFNYSKIYEINFPN